MPLPEGGRTEWPPRDLKPYIDQAVANAAWWSGDRATLKATSGQAGDTQRRYFWQRRSTSDATKATSHLHAPLAADIAAVSADLLFGDGVDLTTDDDNAQAQLEELEENIGLTNLLLEAAEFAAATGGVYLRAAWDTEIADHAVSQSYPQTHAAPDFRYGRLTGVTLWEDLVVDGADVWRHLERHDKGRVEHGLYVGSATELGTSVSLAMLPQTADLVGKEKITLTGRLAGRLLVSYVPHVLPNRTHPWKPIGRPAWDGAHDFLDALDETWTSLMRDIRLGKAHITVAQEWLEATGSKPGDTRELDMDTEAFTGLNVADSNDQGSAFQMFQPDIRVEAHLDAMLALTERVVSVCGYSPQTFGLHIDGRAESGTALRVREGKTDKTVGRQQGYWRPNVASHVSTLLDIGAEVFGLPTIGDPKGAPVKVGFPELEQDPVDKATWIKSLREARAMSIETGVRAAQPELDEDQVAEEVGRITGEDSVADPAAVGRGFEPDPVEPETVGGQE